MKGIDTFTLAVAIFGFSLAQYSELMGALVYTLTAIFMGHKLFLIGKGYFKSKRG